VAAKKRSGKKSSAKKSTRKTSAKKGSGKKATGKRTLIKPKGDARFVRRDSKGRIRESDDVGRSLTQDRKRKAKKKAKSGQGDRGDR
jgi:hypothetical protein